MQALGLSGPKIQEEPTFDEKVWRGVVWLLTEAGTELPEAGLWFCSTYYGLAALLDRIVSFAALRGYIDSTTLGLWALCPASFAAVAVICALRGQPKASRWFRDAALIGYVWFYLGVGIALLVSLPTAPGLGFYWWSAGVALVTRLRPRPKNP